MENDSSENVGWSAVTCLKSDKISDKPCVSRKRIYDSHVRYHIIIGYLPRVPVTRLSSFPGSSTAIATTMISQTKSRLHKSISSEAADCVRSDFDLI